MEKQFEIRTYSFCELAQLYNPNITKGAAVFRLKAWIKNKPELSTKINLNPYTRILTPKQVKLIIEYFDEP